MSRPTRRRFLQGATLGTASLTVPTFLYGCSKSSGAVVASATAAPPANPFLTWFGIDEAMMRTVLAELTRGGADAADLYFQFTRSNSISLEDGIVSKASSSIDEGVGLRCVVGDQTGYAFTEDLTLESMKAAARTASAIANNAAAPAPEVFTWGEVPSQYNLEVPWSDVGIDTKLPKLQELEQLARGLDPAVKSVRIWWSDSEERVLVADARGFVFTDVRPQTRLWCSITAEKDGVTVSNGANLAGRKGIEFYDSEALTTLAQQAIDRTMVLFDARRPPAGEMPVVLAAGASGILLHEAIGHGMEADFNRKGVSIYSEMIGKK
ncbi:MAG: TldD/PmbA family protein, partial [Deltaproteobacteria bacterium]|nr:TldD/PmbA family protein [Deltaproteobacteria bacterium]